jgi:hypothetical protein
LLPLLGSQCVLLLLELFSSGLLFILFPFQSIFICLFLSRRRLLFLSLLRSSLISGYLLRGGFLLLPLLKRSLLFLSLLRSSLISGDLLRGVFLLLPLLKRNLFTKLAKALLLSCLVFLLLGLLLQLLLLALFFCIWVRGGQMRGLGRMTH